MTFDADLPLLLGEIDPRAEHRRSHVPCTRRASAKRRYGAVQPGSAATRRAGDYNTCYPPAVNYDPLLLPDQRRVVRLAPESASLSPSGCGCGRRAVASMCCCVSSMRACTCTCPRSSAPNDDAVAEDGNPLPGVRTRVQSEVLLAAGKTYDVTIQPARTGNNLRRRDLCGLRPRAQPVDQQPARRRHARLHQRGRGAASGAGDRRGRACYGARIPTTCVAGRH